jgi:RNA polymerase sigma factor (sigma-70 family)
MGEGRSGGPLRSLRALFAAGTATGLTDGELLEWYTAKRAESAEAAMAAETAFATLLDRHGAMVWGVCCRVLGNVHEAEDAFQATFLVLVRKAGSVRVDGSLGRWLYGVAHRVALRARAEARRRGAGTGRFPPARSDDPQEEAELRELRAAVGAELDRLPGKYRCPVELCDIQGMTYDQAARQLSCSAATVKSRLARGRLRLKERLARRAFAPGALAVGVAAVFTGEARATVPQELIQSTARAATARAAGAVPAAVTELSEGVLKMMMWEKLKLVAAGAIVAVGLTARAVSQQAPDGGDTAPRAAAQPADTPKDKPGGDRRWVRSLPCGAIIEVVGVSIHPSGPDTWWRPDGTPLPAAPCDPDQSSVSGQGGFIRSVVVRIARLPDGADHQWSISGAGSMAQGQARRRGRAVAGLSEVTAFFPADAGPTTVHFKVAAGPWKTIQTWGKNAGGVGGIDASYIFGDPIATEKGTAISVTHDIRDKSVRLIAIDGDGKEHPPEIRSGTGVKNFQQIVVEFDRPLDQIKEFRLQTRSYEEVEIPRIALKRR